MNHLQNKSFPLFNLALVTGASSGLGMALCKLLAQQQIPLIIAGRDVERLETLAKQLQALVPVTVVTGDLTQIKDCEALVKVINERAPDLVVNNAGFGLYGPVLSYGTKEQLEILEVNAKVLMQLTIEGARTLFSKGKSGTILNISSAADCLIFPNFAAYAASKAFVSSFSQALDYELRPSRIRVLVSSPGMVKTAFRLRASQGSDATSSSMSMDVDYAVKQIWKQIINGRRRKVFDWKTAFGTFITKILPQAVVAKILARSIESFHPPRPYIITPPSLIK